MIHYNLSFAQYYQHLVKVQIRFSAQPQQKIWMPTWIPGSYLIREFAKHIESVNAQDLHSQQNIKIQKISKNEWQIFNHQATEIEVSYQVYAYDLSVRGAYVDDERLYINPAAVCISVEEQEDTSVELTIKVPEQLQHFELATSLEVLEAAPLQYQLAAKNYHDLIDQPFELAVLSNAHFNAENIPHSISISGNHNTDLNRLSADLTKICQAQIRLFGEAPFERYLFMVMATANMYGGLEHQWSTSLITPRDDLPRKMLAGDSETTNPSAGYQRFLGLCSHEYFHAWLVKFIRPHNHVKPNLHQEDYTSLLWIFEGITSYYDDLMLYRSGIIDQTAYLELLKEQINRYLSNPGRLIQSVAESSFDAWIKYYRPDENTNNAGTSYYNKGALVALCLDLSLKQQGSNLDELLRLLYQRAKQGVHVDEHTLPQLCEHLTQTSWQQFFDQYVYGTEELPLEKLLTDYGVEVVFDQKVWPLGLKVKDNPEGVLVQHVLRDSAAALAGMSAQDTILALNGIKASSGLLQQLGSQMQSNATIDCHAFRRDELKQFKISNHGFITLIVQLSVINQLDVERWIARDRQ